MEKAFHSVYLKQVSYDGIINFLKVSLHTDYKEENIGLNDRPKLDDHPKH